MGLIAQAQGQQDEAEGYFRQGLTLMRDVQDAQNEAIISKILGEFLIRERGTQDEGCRLLAEAARLYEEMGVPGAEEARAMAKTLGCG